MNTSLRFFFTGLAAAVLGGAVALGLTPEEFNSLRSKAENGNNVAQFHLGRAYSDPQEPSFNLLEAYVWLNIAADNGVTSAPLLANVNSRLNPEQMSEAKRLLQQRREELRGERPKAVPNPVSAAPEAAAAPAESPVSAPALPSPVQPDAPALQGDLQKANAELAAVRKENDQLKAELAKSAAGAAAAEELKRERDQLNASVASSTEELAKLRAASANFEGERNGLLKKIADAEEQQKNGQGLAAELAAANAKVKAAEAEVTRLSASANESGTLRQQQAELSDRIAKLTEEKAAVTTEIAATKAEANAAVGKLNEEVEKLKSENQRLTNAATEGNAATQEKLAAAEKEIARLQSELGQARTQLADATSKLETAAAASAAAAAATQQKDSSSADLAAAVEKAKAAEESLAKVTAERDAVTQQLAAAQATGNSEFARVNTELAEAKSKLAALEEAANKANTERAAAIEKLAALEKNTATPPAEDPEMRRQLDEATTKLNASLRSFQLQQEEIERLQKALASVDTERGEIADKLRNVSSQASTASAQAASNSEAASQLNAVREQLRQTQNQVASLATENSALKNRIALFGAAPASHLSAPTRPAATSAAPAGRAPQRPSAAAPADGRTHTVASGDTLGKISRQYYGTTERWKEILEANKETIKNPTSLTIGAKLKIP